MSDDNVLHFKPVTLAPGVVTDVSVRPSTPFIPRRLVVGLGHDHATIHSLKIRGHDQFIPGASLPAAAFGPGVGPLNLDAVQPNDEIMLTVSSAKGGMFAGSLVGHMGESPMPEPLVEEAQKAVREAEEAYEPGVTIDEETGELRGDD